MNEAEFKMPPLPEDHFEYNQSLSKGTILRYRVDLISVLVVFLALGVQFAAYHFSWPWYAEIGVLLLMRQAQLVEHNHAHLPIFKNHWLNEFFGWGLFLNGGIPLEMYRYQHVKVHHGFFGTSQDWTSPFNYQGCKSPNKPVNLFYYLATYSLLSICESVNFFVRNPHRRSSKNFFLSVLVAFTAMAALCINDPKNFLLFYGITWALCSIGIAANNWSHHSECEMDSIYTSCNVNLLSRCRFLGFNIGYHSAHHWHPSLHWIKLPEFHKKHLAKHIPEKFYVKTNAKSLPRTVSENSLF
jgi:fatty acid desaturase